jgi:hypothetical protein
LGEDGDDVDDTPGVGAVEPDEFEKYRLTSG